MHFTSDVKEALNHKYSDIADEMIKDGKDIVSLCVGEPDMKVPTYVIDGIYKAMLEGKTHYSNSQGIKELRDAIAQDVNNIYGCEYIGGCLADQTSNNIAKYAGDISEAEQRALAYEAEIKKKEDNLETLRKKLAEEIAMSQKAANATWRDISDISFEEGDRYLLANLIYCEAGGEPYDGQLAVASVVINRVRSSVYPNTVVGVIYQNKQFSPVASGRLELALAANKATSRCYQAADEAMSGVTNVGNCVYFRTPVEGLTGISIGGHIFY